MTIEYAYFRRQDGKFVAVLVEDYPFVWRNIFGDSFKEYEMVFNKQSLMSRAENLEARGFDVSIERDLLSRWPEE